MYLSILLAIYDIGPHIMGGEQVTRSEWLHIAAPLVAVIGILMVFIAYGFAGQKPWSRHLVIAMFSLIIVYAAILGALNLIHHAIMWRAIINASVFGGASVWYFYFKTNVAAYFRERLSDDVRRSQELGSTEKSSQTCMTDKSVIQQARRPPAAQARRSESVLSRTGSLCSGLQVARELAVK
jgi:hypothetical protein